MKKRLLPRMERQLPPVAVALLAALATVLATWTAYSVYGSRDRDRFQSRVSEISEAIEGRLSTYVVLLHAAGALIGSSGYVDESGLRAFVERVDLHARYPGMRGIGFVTRVTANEREEFEQRMSGGHGADFEIRSSAERAEYFPVVALEPHDATSHAALGFDMSSEQKRRAAMERARDSGLPAASAAVPSSEDASARAPLGIVVYVPVYRAGITPADAGARRSQLVGFVFSTLDAEELITASVPPSEHAQVGFRVLDGAAGDRAQQIYASDDPPSGDAPRTFSTARKVDMAGQDWTIAFRTRPPFDEASRLHVVPYVLGGGCLISLLLFVAMREQARAQHQAEHTASVLQSLLLARRESEARRAAILESSIDAVIAMNESGDITEFNRAAEHTFGCARAEVLTRDLFDTLLPASSRDELRSGFARYLETGEGAFLGQRLETTARRGDGSEFAAEVTVSEIGLDSGREFTAHVRDITERREYEERLRVERETVETLHRVTSSFAAKLELQPLIQDAIDAATSAAGAQCGVFFYSGPVDEQEEGARIFAVAGIERTTFDAIDLPRPTSLLGATFSSRLVLRLADVAEDARQGKNAPHFGVPVGHPPVRSYLAVPVVTGGGVMLGSILLGHALPGAFTERHESVVLAIAAQAAVSLDKALLYRAAQDARRAAELANRAKDEFLATLSHELRTPLTAILGWCQLLTRGKRSEAEVARGLERIESSAQAQTRLISDLLDVSRIVSGKLRLEVQPLGLEPVIEAAIEAIRPAAVAKAIEVRIVVDHASIVAGDASRLQQVFWNLLSNAVKFTPKNGRIEVRLAESAGHVSISVRDDGCGIRAEDLACIFDRFRQVDSSTTRRSGGLGLGLAIVRHLVELHGGTVRAESEGDGHGATFHVSLPVLSMRPSARVITTADSDRLLADAGSAHPQVLSGLRVLVVDDDGETRELIKVILEEFGAEVAAVPSVTRALEQLARARPDVLVSDIAMPERDGYDLIRHVRGLRADEGGKTPALALTAFARSEDSRRALLAGFQMHAAKPVEPEELVSMVASLARRPLQAAQRWP